MSGSDKQYVEECRVEYDVAMVAEEGVAQRLVCWQQTVVEADTIRMLTNDMPYDRFHETLLEVQRCLDTYKQQFQETIAYTLW